MKSWINEVNKTADRDKSGRGSTPKAKTPKRPFISLQRQDLKPVSQFWMCTRSIWKIPETTLPSSISHQLLIKPNFYRRAQISTVFKAIHTISTRISRGLRTTSSNKKSYIVPGASLGSHAGSPISQQRKRPFYMAHGTQEHMQVFPWALMATTLIHYTRQIVAWGGMVVGQIGCQQHRDLWG